MPRRAAPRRAARGRAVRRARCDAAAHTIRRAVRGLAVAARLSQPSVKGPEKAALRVPITLHTRATGRRRPATGWFQGTHNAPSGGKGRQGRHRHAANPPPWKRHEIRNGRGCQITSRRPSQDKYHVCRQRGARSAAAAAAGQRGSAMCGRDSVSSKPCVGCGGGCLLRARHDDTAR